MRRRWCRWCSPILMAAVVSAIGCGNRREPPSKGKDGATAAAPEMMVRWNPLLANARRLVVSGGFVIGEWVATTAPEPAPPELRAFLIDTGEQTQRDRGWVLYAGGSPTNAVVVDEQPTVLTYVVRTFSRPTDEAVPLPSPGDGTWPLRGVACGKDPSYCAVVRWSPRTGAATASPGQPERLAITVVDANAMSVGKTHIIESPDQYAGTPTIGGIHANPAKPEIYILEWQAGSTSVRCISLDTGEQRWRTELPPVAPSAPSGNTLAIPTPDGTAVIVARGSYAHGLFELADLVVIDASTGQAAPAIQVPDGWRQVILTPDHEGDALVALRVEAVRRGMGESPDFSFLGISRFDSKAGRFSHVFDPADGAKDPSEVPERRWKAPTDGLMTGHNEVLLVPHGGSLAGQDASLPGVARQRADAVTRLLGQ